MKYLMYQSPSGKDFYPSLYHNKLAVSGSYISSNGYKTGTFDVVFSPQKGDVIYPAGSGTYTFFSNSFAHVTFSGHGIV